MNEINIEAYGQLVSKYQTQIYNLVYKLVGNPQDALDITQETFLQGYKAFNSFEGRSQFSTWIYRIATNKALDFLRKKQRKNEYLIDNLEYVSSQPQVMEQQSCDSTEKEFLKKETRESVQQGIALLPDHYRVVIILHHFQGKSYKEIADILQISERTVATRLYRAKLKLKEVLEESLFKGSEAYGL